MPEVGGTVNVVVYECPDCGRIEMKRAERATALGPECTAVGVLGPEPVAMTHLGSFRLVRTPKPGPDPE